MDLNYKIQTSAPFTHFDVKNPIKSKLLKKQGQTISLEDMAYKIGQNIVVNKHKFVNVSNSLIDYKNVDNAVGLR